MTKRASVFEADDLDEATSIDLSHFGPKENPKADAMPPEQMKAAVAAANFPSREAKKAREPAPAAPKPEKVATAKRAPRRQYRTGRSEQVNVRASAQTHADFYAIVDGELDGRKRSAAETFELAIAALKRELDAKVS